MGTNVSMTTLEAIPRRIFFDTGVVHYLWRYGEFVFDNVEISTDDRLHGVPYGLEDLEALQAFCVMNRRNAFEIVVSQNSLNEVASAGESRYTSYLLELADYWGSTTAAYENSPFTGSGVVTAALLADKCFGYLSAKDRVLLADACTMECDTFLTVDRRLARSAHHLKHKLDISVEAPVTLLRRLQPWAGLLL